MAIEEITKKFSDQINLFLNRIKINHIVCHTPYFEGVYWTEAQADAFLKESTYNKLPINNIFLLNDHNNANIKFQSQEDTALNDALVHCCQFMVNEVVEFCKKGENKYELNKLLRANFIFLDLEIKRMNYKTWWEETFTNGNDDIFFVLYGTKKIWKSKAYIDIQSSCMHFVDPQFNYRQHLLYRLKDCLIDIYSEFLLLPEIGANPKIEVTCKPTDICELLMAIDYSNKIIDSAKLKAILMEMFGISGDTFKSASYEIRNRPSGKKSIFLKKLSDDLDYIPATKKSPKNEE